MFRSVQNVGVVLRFSNAVTGVLTLALFGYVMATGVPLKSLPTIFLAIIFAMSGLDFALGLKLSQGEPANGPPPAMGRVVARRIVATETVQNNPQLSYLLKVLSPNGLGERWVEVSRQTFEYHAVSSLYVPGR